MPLSEYAKKRNFDITHEPVPKSEDLKTQRLRYCNLIFVVQEHHASHLHWDFRLEHKGILKSWAVPKEPPAEEGVKRLAIEVEDHPLDYANFEGEIAEGQYGAGVVKIWDRGTYTAEKFSDSEIIIELSGKKMKGKYVLIRAKFSKNSWLLFKKKA